MSTQKHIDAKFAAPQFYRLYSPGCKVYPKVLIVWQGYSAMNVGFMGVNNQFAFCKLEYFTAFPNYLKFVCPAI